MTQKERVERWLKIRGSITPIEALDELGVHNLSAVILRLSQEGYNIKKGSKSKIGRYGDVKFTEYTLHKGEGAEL